MTPVGGAGYSLYVTGNGHGVAGLLYGPDGVLITGAQLAAVRGENRLGRRRAELGIGCAKSHGEGRGCWGTGFRRLR